MLALDRQWLAFGPEGEIYLSWLQQPAGIWIARSDDGENAHAAQRRFSSGAIRG